MGTRCVYARPAGVCARVLSREHACHPKKVSEISRQALLILQGSLRNKGGRIHIHLAVLSRGGGGGIPSIIRAQG